MVRFSLGLQLDYPIGEAVDVIKTADALGFHGCYVADDPSLGIRGCCSVRRRGTRRPSVWA